MKKLIWFILIFTVFAWILFSCKERTSTFGLKSETSYRIQVDKNQKNSIFDIFSKIDITPLETNEKCVIKKVEKIVLFHEKCFVYDEEQKALFIFNEKGEFLNKVQKIGNGPGEFSLLDDFNINKFTNEIELLNPRGELLKYDLEGNYKGSITLPNVIRAYHKFCNISEDLIVLFSEFESKKISYYSRKENKIIHQEYEIPVFILANTPLISLKSSPFYYSNEKTYFTIGSTNNVYEVTPVGLKYAFEFDFGDNTLDIGEMSKNASLDYYKNYLVNKNYVFGLRFTNESDEYLLTRFIYNKRWFTLIYNKLKGNYYLVARFTEGLILPEALTIFDQGIYSSIEPAQIQLFLKPEFLDLNNKTILKGIKYEDNPVIVKYFFK